MNMRVIVSGGGTAGHIYPALAVAEELRSRGAEVLFVGANGKMEMERVPLFGFKIVGLPIAGIRRSMTPSAILHNIKVPFKMLSSTRRARRVIKEFRPDVVVGFGGYASAPIVRAAQKMSIPTLLQEQNSYAGLTNRVLAKGAKAICVAYRGMERFFDGSKIKVTGNPLLGNLQNLPSKDEAAKDLSLRSDIPTLLVTGGSLGTRTLNEMVFKFLSSGYDQKIQIIWQCGKFYHSEFLARVGELSVPENITFTLVPFIEKMASAYALSDLVLCRSGASTVSELQLLGKPVLFVPSPNVAEDHQTANARAVVEAGGALMVSDSEAVQSAMNLAIETLNSSEKLKAMSKAIGAMAHPNSTKEVADIVESQVKGASKEPKRVYFVGVGGIGMSALARFFRAEGYMVAGYDRVRTPLCEALESEGMEIHYEDSVELIPSGFRDPSGVEVIYTPAIPKDHSELCWFRDSGFNVVKRSAALGLLCRDKYTMAVAGTHGKSSTTTLVAWLNHSASTDGTGSAFLGAISKNFGTNTVMGSGDRMAVEADEFDRSFHSLHPNVALITAADPDHLDIYGTAEAFKEGFEKFVSQCSEAVIIKEGVELSVPSGIRKYSYSLDRETSDYRAQNIVLGEDGLYSFDVVTPKGVIKGCKLGVPGLVNVENAVGAIALLDMRGYDEDGLRRGLESFKGIERRFDMWFSTPTKAYMDDYAHHPEELRTMLNSLRAIFPSRHITVAFQPHLYSRTKDFAAGFAESLSLADRVVLIPIYPAREEPIEGVTSKIIYDGVTVEKYLVGREELAETIASLECDVVVTAGAGDIDMLRRGVYEVLSSEEARDGQ